MEGRKQKLLRRHRRNKRIILLAGLLLINLAGIFIHWALVPLVLLLAWLAHEAWFADHLFYSPSDDYRYLFPEGTQAYAVLCTDGYLRIQGEHSLPADVESHSLFLEWRVQADWRGRWCDPQVWIGDDRQEFERGVNGVRWLNLSGQQQALVDGRLTLRTRFCRLRGTGRLVGFRQPDYARQRLMVLAPHADDAELAAFGLYSRAAEACIVTVSQGEIEAGDYQRLGLDKPAAARLKGRLRAWDSLSVPLWGGIAQSNCVQLGYYCLQLAAMREEPESAFGSRESGEADIRSVRQHNPLRLPGDADGLPSWTNLVADLSTLLEHFRPQVVVTPHPEIDPHADHIAATQALLEAIAASSWKPDTLLLYANHLPDNDRWPMGPAGCGIALPPAIEPQVCEPLWSPLLSAEAQLDKAMALHMQHDLVKPLKGKLRLRRAIQRLLAGRRWPATGEDEFFRKAVRRHELFWVRPLQSGSTGETPGKSS
jgi:LmbE family N-acetylglucosaminyl deacetylase